MLTRQLPLSFWRNYKKSGCAEPVGVNLCLDTGITDPALAFKQLQ